MARQISQALIFLCAASLALHAADVGADPKQTGPVGLVIQYQCRPSKRAAFRHRLRDVELASFARWRSEGLLADYHVLFSRYADSNTWDALVLLTFPDYHAASRWKEVEARNPAGLSPEALELVSSLETYPVDLLRSNAPPPATPDPVYLVIPYTFSVSAAEYLTYADDYVRPQFEGWMKEGILSGYQIFLQRYTADRPWDTMIFLKYRDDEGFGQREKVVARVRGQLQSNPVWKAASDGKHNLRVEKEAVIADELSAPQRRSN
jgi:hypothetical protein